MPTLAVLTPLIVIITGIVLVGLGGVLATAVVIRQRKQLVALRTELVRQVHRLEVLERDFGAVMACSRRIGDRIGAGERTQRTLQHQLDRLKFNDDSDVAVEHAMKLLQSGLALTEVSRLCDLTEGEAEILDNLARHRQAA